VRGSGISFHLVLLLREAGAAVAGAVSVSVAHFNGSLPESLVNYFFESVCGVYSAGPCPYGGGTTFAASL
jgi:hypothetical protein